MPVWAYEPISQRIQRQRQEREALRSTVVPLVERGDYTTARQAIAARQREKEAIEYRESLRSAAAEAAKAVAPAPEKKKKGGGFLSKLKDPGEWNDLKDIGSGLLTAADAGREYLGAPLAGGVIKDVKRAARDPLNPRNALLPLKELSGQRARETAAGLGAKLARKGGADLGRVGQGLEGGYEANRAEYRAFREDERVPIGLRVAADIATDPTTYIGPGALKGALRAAPAAVRAGRGARLAGALLEQPGRVALGGAVGAGVGAQLGEGANIGPYGALAATLGGAVAGGGIGATARRPAFNREAFRAGLQAEAGNVAAPIAARAGLAAAGAGIGYATGDTPEERANRALLGGGLGFGVGELLAHRPTRGSFQAPREEGEFAVGGKNSFFRRAQSRPIIPRVERYPGGEKAPTPYAKERIWVHSTSAAEDVFERPVANRAVGQAVGITQGPGIYTAADPRKSAGRYGQRSFFIAFDGNELDLTRIGSETDDLAGTGRTWTDVREALKARLTAAGLKGEILDDAFLDKHLRAAKEGAFSDVARRSDGLTNYTYRDTLVNAVARAIKPLGREIDGDKAKALFGRFSDAANRQYNDLPYSRAQNIVQDVLGDSGIDAVFHYSPGADGDVLIIINGEKARIVGEGRGVATFLKDDPGDLSALKKAAGDSLTLYDQPISGATLLGQNRLAVKQAPEVGQRTGVLLRPRGLEQLGEKPTGRQIMDVAPDLLRQQESVANSIRASAENAMKKMGRVDDAGFMLDVAPSQADLRAGLAHPSFYRVIERPADYTLSLEQRNGLEEMASFVTEIKAEREFRGVGPNVLKIEGDGEFFPRQARQPSAISQAKMKIAGAAMRGQSKGSPRLSGAPDKQRIFREVNDALQAGVEYAHPLESLDAYVRNGLKASADAHMKGLLSTVGQTAAQRIPPALKARVDGLKQQLRSLQATSGRLGDRTDRAIAEFLAADLHDSSGLWKVYAALDQRVGGVGVNAGANRQTILAKLADIRKEIEEVSPLWEEAQKQAKIVPADRTVVNPQLAPALMGMDFTPEDAKRISAFYGRVVATPTTQTGKLVEKVRPVNVLLVPLQLTADLSALLNQQGRMAVNNPGLYLKNVALGFRDMVAPEKYNRVVGGQRGRHWSSRGLAIAGEAGQRNEFEFGSWVERVPGFGHIAKTANAHYQRFNTRMRLDVADTIADANRRMGQPLDARGEEQLAKAVNRLTGVSTGRAGDLETLGSLAPNFFRSHFENLAHGIADGSIEGQVARRYLGTYFGFGAAVVWGGAIASGRDPSEVLTPIDMDALERGQLRLNSNFGTVRIGGHDIQVFGPYTGVARLAIAATDATYWAGRGAATGDPDASAAKIIGFLSDTAQMRGSPLVRIGADLGKGETFTGEDPMGAAAWAQRFLPISISNVIAARRDGLSWKDATLDSISSAIGAQSNPMSPTEKLNQVSQREAGMDFFDLKPTEQRRVREANPELYQRYLKNAGEETKAAVRERERLRSQQAADNQLLMSGEITRQQWLEAYKKRRDEQRTVLEYIYKDKPKQKTEGARGVYFQAIDDATDPETGRVDWESVDIAVARLSPAEQAEIAEETGLYGTEEPLGRAYKKLGQIQSDYYAIPKYRIYTADEGYAIDRLLDDARALAGSSEDVKLLRAIRQLSAGVDPRIIQGARRVAVGLVGENAERKRYRKAHPEMNILSSYSRGRLTEQEKQTLLSLGAA